MLFKKNPKIEKICLYCEKAVCTEEEGEPVVTCRRKGKTEPGGHCLHFRYDPLKRKPKKRPRLIGLEEEIHKDMILD